MASIQDTRAMAVVESPLKEDELLFRRMRVSEGLSVPFEFDLELLSKNDSLKYEDVLGRGLGIRLDLPKQETPRYFHGVVTRFTYEGKFDGRIGRYSLYRAILRPWLWLLTHTADSRIFQEKTVPDILGQVFDDHGFSDLKKKISGDYPKREYCVQYRETDFAFVSRMMEEAGIYYFFTHEKNKHTLVLCDSYSAHGATIGYGELRYIPPQLTVQADEEEHVFDWQVSQEVQTGVYSLRDFDFEVPKADLEVKNAKDRQHTHAKFEIYDYPGRYTKSKDGEGRAKTWLEALQAGFERARGQSNARGLSAGALLKITDFPRDDHNREYLIVSVSIEMNSDTFGSQVMGRSGPGAENKQGFACRFVAMDSKLPFRAPRATPRALVHGPQTAVVVGPKGEEIWTDKYGRVKVQFHWDREGKKDENSSCWIRVAHVWAGKTWGGIFLPRIGQEVIIEFLEGDPDRPIITGRVYNAEQMPPYELPANQTKSGLQTRSTTKGDAKTFNELRFEDKKDKEEIYFHAERDFNRVVENNDTLKVGYDHKSAGDQTIEIYNNRTLTIEKGHQSHTIKTGDDKITVNKGNRTVKISAGKQSTEAAKEILLKVGGSSIKIDQQGVTIKGMKIMIDGGVKVDVKSTMTTVKGNALLTLKGGLTKFN